MGVARQMRKGPVASPPPAPPLIFRSVTARRHGVAAVTFTVATALFHAVFFTVSETP
ncbi:hypothetical protein GA0070563_10721 [Micromonospora carbonacea]|uniref:Uncharacterized protein n=1 Tax=Micromonospora carbonacea TaxID=47853 RepID=A0A1C4YWS8_9ACTN|nr:hypothetical protein GA0070563_10721 [Micromonospora carbonacea]